MEDKDRDLKDKEGALDVAIMEKIREFMSGDSLFVKDPSKLLKIYTGKGGMKAMQEAFGGDTSPSTTYTTTMRPIQKVMRPYRQYCSLTQDLILANGWKWKEDNGMRWWYTKEDLFNESPCEAPSYQIQRAMLVHDPELNWVKITVRRRGETEDEVMFDGKCFDLSTLLMIENLTNVSGIHNPK